LLNSGVRYHRQCWADETCPTYLTKLRTKNASSTSKTLLENKNMIKLIHLAFIIFLLALSACTTTDERAKLKNMNEYRSKVNETMKRQDFLSELLLIARKDPKFDTVFVAQTKAYLDRKKLALPKVKKNVAPIFPASKRREWREGVLEFALIVGRNGKITYISHVAHQGLPVDEEFITVARDALQQWEYEPATIDGEAIEYALLAPVSFKLT
jgi:hypothetical protein